MGKLLAELLVPLALAILREAMARKDMRDAVIGKVVAVIFKNAQEAADYLRRNPPRDGIIVRLVPRHPDEQPPQAGPPTEAGG